VPNDRAAVRLDPNPLEVHLAERFRKLGVAAQALG
jgi:hypothetical protein